MHPCFRFRFLKLPIAALLLSTAACATTDGRAAGAVATASSAFAVARPELDALIAKQPAEKQARLQTMLNAVALALTIAGVATQPAPQVQK